MSYQVFARKYRPRTFDEILGQDHVVRTLKNAIATGRLAHAYLFVGPRGTGKTTTARILSKALCCSGGPKADFDPDEPLCLEIAEGRALDVLEIDGASNNGVEEVRSLRETVSYAPTNGPFKIYYIDEVHMLSNNAFNALLKTLEEPPEHVKFIFATTEPNKILPTILSRCQRFDLRHIPSTIIADHLLHIAGEEGIQLDPVAAHTIARGAAGGMRDAQSMLDQLVAFCGEKITEADVLEVFGFTSHETVSGLAAAILNQDSPTALKAITAQAESGKDLGVFISDLLGWFRALLVHQVDPSAAEAELPKAMVPTLQAQSAVTGQEGLLSAIEVLAAAEANMKWSPNRKLHFEIAAIKAAGTIGSVTISQVLEALAGGNLPTAPTSKPSSQPQTQPAEEPLSTTPAPAAVTAQAPAPKTHTEPVPEAPPEPPVAADPVQVIEEAPPSAPSANIGAAAAVGASASGLASAVLSATQESPPETEESPVADQPQPPENDAPTETAFTPPSDETAQPVSQEDDGGDLWQKGLVQIQEKRPLVAHWADLGILAEESPGNVKISLPAGSEHAIDGLGRKAVKEDIDQIFSELTGAPTRAEFFIDPSREAPPQPEALAPQARAQAEAVVQAQKASPAAPTASSAAQGQGRSQAKNEQVGDGEGSPTGSLDDHEKAEKDPLIAAALEVFQAKLES